ncbi:NAD(P)-binding protein [Hortaea werneckii]|nr:NAD(P)-binding protein [Hortaea werneckii]
MAPKVFITGATGYIAGDATHVLYSAHPDWEYSLLVRTQDKADILKKAFPNTRTVLGSLEDSETLKTEAAKADIVLHAADASDHEGAARAIAAGLAEGHSKENPGFWLHTGGTGILTFEDEKKGKLGEHEDNEWNDWSRVDELTHLPDDAFHRNVDIVVLDAGTKHADAVKTAIVCPPTIYGKGRGPIGTRSRQAYELAKLMLEAEYIPIIGEGKAQWDHVHVHDLSQVYLKLAEAAAAKQTSNPEMWGAKGYYFTQGGRHTWGDFAKAMGKKAEELGLVSKKLEPASLSREKALQQADFQAVSWGLNSQGKGERAQKVLGWQPKGQGLYEEIPVILQSEAERLDKKKA